MATWESLLTFDAPALSKQVFLMVGEISALVMDKVNHVLDKYSTRSSVTKVQHLSFASSLGADGAYLVIDPSPEVLDTVAVLVKQGCPDSFFVLMPDAVKSEAFETVKKKAQQCKMYFTCSAPKTENAQDKMAAFFSARWGVPRHLALRSCALLDFSPGRLYLLDWQFLSLTGGNLLPSSTTAQLMEDLLGADSKNMVVDKILSGQQVKARFTISFVEEVLKFLSTLLQNARLVAAAMSSGSTNPSQVSTLTGLTQFQVVQAMGLQGSASLGANSQLVAWALKDPMPDSLSVLAQMWRK